LHIQLETQMVCTRALYCPWSFEVERSKVKVGSQMQNHFWL